MFKCSSVAAVFLVACCAILPAWGQSWPTKPIVLAVGRAPCSAPDVYARAIAEPMSRLNRVADSAQSDSSG